VGNRRAIRDQARGRASSLASRSKDRREVDEARPGLSWVIPSVVRSPLWLGDLTVDSAPLVGAFVVLGTGGSIHGAAIDVVGPAAARVRSP
jgi:hypothetical protein